MMFFVASCLAVAGLHFFVRRRCSRTERIASAVLGLVTLVLVGFACFTPTGLSLLSLLPLEGRAFTFN